jgi:hypothetical protein
MGPRPRRDPDPFTVVRGSRRMRCGSG